MGELLLVCWYTLHIYPLLPVEFQSVIVLAPSQTCIYTRTKVSLSICLSRVPPVFLFFFPTRCVLRHRPVFFFFSPAYCFQFFLFYRLFLSLFVCLFFDTKSKRNQKFWNTWRRPRGYATAISDGSRMTIEILIAFHLLLQLSTTVCGKSLFLFFVQKPFFFAQHCKSRTPKLVPLVRDFFHFF